MQTNKEIVTAFHQQVFVNGDLSDINKFVKEDYIQHNPEVANGREGFVKFLHTLLQQKLQYDTKNISADGDMVYVFYKTTDEQGHQSKTCDIYRLENGQIAEHWDVIEENIEKIKSVNGNSVF
ncbi:nuclear transport factor 2 family protein [Snodgrassella sp. CS2]|uniref:nuclear transport factor 2 family protein n=1 Tax=Snodgrassella sp. CS2 TaxID=3418953 RepID=UPI003D038479